MNVIARELRLDALGLFNETVKHVPAILVAVAIVVITRFAAGVLARSSRALGARAVRSLSLRILLEKAAVIGTWTLGVLLAALVAFPGLSLGDVFATLGLTSVAIGFAFQDIFKNFLAGVLLLLNEPFRIGDQIVVANFEGTVEHIDIRTTELRTYTGERVLVPNATVFTSPVQVRTAYGFRRVDIEVGLEYGVDLARASKLLRDALRELDVVRDEPPPRVDVVAFGDSSVNFVVRFWTDARQVEFLVARSRAIAAIDAVLREADVAIAFPTRTLVFSNPLPARAQDGS